MSLHLYSPPEERRGRKSGGTLPRFLLYFVLWLVVAADLFANLFLGGLSEPNIRPCVVSFSSSWQLKALFFLPPIAGAVVQIWAIFLTSRGNDKAAKILVAAAALVLLIPAMSILGWPGEINNWIPAYSYSGCG